MKKVILSKNIHVLLTLMIVAVINGERVKVPETLRSFLGTLEYYEDKQTDIVFLLDDSGSITADKFPEVTKFSKIIAQHLSVSSQYNRIAVLTFSTDTVTYVDYIQNPDGNMCSLGKKIDSIYYSAGWTHTDLAMKEAENILARGTSPNKTYVLLDIEVNEGTGTSCIMFSKGIQQLSLGVGHINVLEGPQRVVMLLTDGESNAGHSPVPMARTMKSKGIVIFAIGVANVNKKEIDDVATSIDHTYILDNFDEIDKVNRYLVEDLRDDHLDKEEDARCDSECDDNAKCYCGTRTGRYECICNVGYHGVGGKRGQCQKCPKGTYKEKSANTNCTACPTHSTTQNEGSTSISDCLCDPGFEKYGNRCSPVTCAPLTAPRGGFLIPRKCSNTYGSKCSFYCREGYCPFSCSAYDVVHPNKTHILLPDRTCLETRKWSKDEFICEKMMCAALNSPLNGYYKCSENDFSHGITCKYSCDKGYELIGSEYRKCEFGSWTGEDASCKAITCDQLKTNDILKVRPDVCAFRRKPFPEVCTYYCIGGYDLVLQKGNEEEISDGVLKCGADGKWSVGVNFKCKDKEPPIITCPPSIKVIADPNKGFASHVTWKEPNVTDNVKVKYVTIIEPKGYDKNFVFPINNTKVVYEASDISNLKSTCSFLVEVIDNEPPKVISCPSDIQKYSDSNRAIPVTWHGPNFEDNSGKVSYTSDRKSGDLFAWGPPSVVHFYASDPSNNTASCSFTITIKPYECPYYRPPANGLLACDNWNHGRLCSIHCHEGFEFAAGRDLTGPYFCQQTPTGKKWIPWKPIRNFKMPWPDCSRIQAAISFNVSAGISYTVDSCSDHILQQMREKFFDIAKNLPSVLCPQTVKNGCSPENVQITCNPIEIRRKRRSASSGYMQEKSASDYGRKTLRSVQEAIKQKLTISFDIVVPSNNTDKEPDLKQTQLPQSGNQNDGSFSAILKTLEDNISLEVKDIYHLASVPDPSVNYDVSAICSIGQIKVNNSCIYCPPGTYKDDVSETCINCPQASYQDIEGMLSCKPCPVGYTTYQVKSVSKDDCKGPCQPGTYSTTAFEPCFACPLNTYQDRSTRKQCLKCPPGLYTWKVGSNSSSDCVAPCQPGTFSNTGYEPCTLCDVGSFQDKEMQKNCSICPYGKSTLKEGAKHIKECKEIDICNDLRPCHPDSTCIQHDKEYECICPEGLLGKNCEIDFDDCENNPCFNNGSCVDLIGNFSCFCSDGWTGHRCEINRDDCASSPCFNFGECIDKVNAYECQCKPGFSGERCETNIYECESNPCLNNGTCFDMINGYRCCCATDYYGVNCENKSDTNICDAVTCENGGTCIANEENFNCNCLPGFEGSYCELNIDDCTKFLCDNDGVCVDGINNATCDCPSKFTGLHCETALPSEFLLSFPAPVTSNYAKMENKYRLPAITVAFYMRTSYKEPTSRATPVSYSYKYENDVVDNALTFLDTNNFVLYIHGRAIHTEYSANRDADWHHYAVTWEKLHGNWTFYVDGNVIDSGSTGEGKYMHPGVFILGQEQDDIGGQFSTLEAFAGDITEFNVWDYALNKEEIKRILSACGHIGNIIQWYKVSESIYGDIVMSRDVEKCRILGTCPKDSCDCFYTNENYSCKYDVEECIHEKSCFNGQSCISNELHSFCNCSKGFEGRHCEYDVDECLQKNGGCSHICVNDIGTYHCECPEDMLLSEDRKTCKDTSYCLEGNKIYMDGEVWMNSCQNCSCTQGIVKCDEMECEEVTCHEEETEIISPGECCPKCVAWSFCIISPNKTIMSFDTSAYEIEGECTYTAVEDCITGRFKVQIQSSQNSTNETSLVIYQDCSKIIISSNGNILVDDDIVTSPYLNEEFVIEDFSSGLTVKTKSDLLIQWDLRNEAIIGVPITNVHKMCGLCSKIEEYYIYGTGKFPLSERYSPGENQCFIISEGFEENPPSGCFSSCSYEETYLFLLTASFLYIFISNKLICSY